MSQAVDLKNQGNKAFASGDFPAAVDLYSKAIEANSTEPTFYTNRAQVRAPSLPSRGRVTDSLGTHQNRGIWICRLRCHQSHRAQPQTYQGTQDSSQYTI